MVPPEHLSPEGFNFADPVALFPLPNVVLFPRTVLPLHIFEERYKTMMTDVLAGDGLMAMALLQPGWQDQYQCAPAIESVVCVGQVDQHERLEDGRYNFLLKGIARAKIIKEVDAQPYRRAKLKLLEEEPCLEIDLSDQRRRLCKLFLERRVKQSDLSVCLIRMCQSSVPTAHLTDMLAYTFITDAAVKQSLLAETNVRRRVDRVLHHLQTAHPSIPHEASSRKFADIQ